MLWIYGNDDSWQVGDFKPLRIGRDISNEIVIKYPEVSKFHAEINRVNGDYLIRDLNSVNGTYVNKKRIDLNKLNDGDQIQVGRSIFYCSGHETLRKISWRDRIQIKWIQVSPKIKLALSITPIVIFLLEFFEIFVSKQLIKFISLFRNLFE